MNSPGGKNHQLACLILYRFFADSEMVQEFLMESELAVEVEVRVLLPDQSTIALNVRYGSHFLKQLV